MTPPTEDTKTFEIVESTIKNDKLPALSKKRDGFNRSDVVDAFQRSFDMIGGVPRMALWANANPDKFYPLYSKLLPSTSINFGDNAQVIIQHSIPPGPLDDHPE